MYQSEREHADSAHAARMRTITLRAVASKRSHERRMAEIDGAHRARMAHITARRERRISAPGI